MIVNPYGITRYRLVHKNCGARVDRLKYVPGYYVCPKCNAILPPSAVEQVREMVV